MLTIGELREALQRNPRATWTAEETPLFRDAQRGPGAAKGHFGLVIRPETRRLIAAAQPAIFEGLNAAPLASSVNWQTKDGGRVTPVKDQGHCGSCVAFATCAAMESGYWIATGQSLSLSEGHLFYCNGGSCEDGWDFIPALEAARNEGIGLSQDLPYEDDGECRAIRSRACVVHYEILTTTDARKRAIMRAPVIGGMKVYTDLLAYANGVYRHVAGDHEGDHAVCIVGYDDADQCWIVKNSWGAGFGEDGFVRIAYGECELDTANPFFSVEVTEC